LFENYDFFTQKLDSVMAGLGLVCIQLLAFMGWERLGLVCVQFVALMGLNKFW